MSHRIFVHYSFGERRMNRRTATLRTLTLSFTLLTVAACSRKAAKTTAEPHRIAAVEGLSQPEALTFDPGQNVYFVSNVNGSPGVKDGNGFISRITADGVMDSLHFIQGGRNGVQLDGPMGSRVQGDTLWVANVGDSRAYLLRSPGGLVGRDQPLALSLIHI